MWLVFAFVSAFFLGFYDVSKKVALKDNAVILVLLFNTFFSTIFFSIMMIGNYPVIMSSHTSTDYMIVFVKSVIVLSSWILGYIALKHLPITIAGPLNATRPILVLVGAMIVFGERLNVWQWAGVSLAFISMLLMRISRIKEKSVDGKWILCIALAILLGACSGLYDKFIMKRLDPKFVQWWYNLFHLGLMTVLTIFVWYPRKSKMPFHWSWAIILISFFITIADYCYYISLSNSESMISLVSLVRRGSVIVSFIYGAIFLKEKNLKSKAFDLCLIIIGMILIWIGTI